MSSRSVNATTGTIVALRNFGIRYAFARVWCPRTGPALVFAMITCERCGTNNLDGSRYCDECGAALWLAGRSNDLSKAQSNGSDSRAKKDIPVTVARSGKSPAPPVVLEHSTGAVATVPQSAILTIERGKSAGKQFT